MTAARRIGGLMLLAACFATTGCAPQSSGSSAAGGFEGVLQRYESIVNRADAIVARSDKGSPPFEEIKVLAEQVVALRQEKLLLGDHPTAQQAARYETLNGRFQTALHAACPTCPKH
jgi:hypothetical protein